MTTLVSTAAKACSRCGTVQPLTAYAKNSNTRDGLRSECKPCKAISSRAYLLKTRFGISVAEYDQLLMDQGGRCALCLGVSAKGRWGNRLHVDHCHTTGRVRGLLCNPCNGALGVLGDSPAALARAFRYVSSEGVDHE